MEIIQFVREIKPGGGVSGVAYNLDQEFKKKGIECRNVTIESFGIKPVEFDNVILSKLFYILYVYYFSIIGSIYSYFLTKRENVVTLVHNDVIVGDIYIDHGLHKKVVDENKNILLKNIPLHGFLLVREEVRHFLNLYKRVVEFSSATKKDFLEYYGRYVDEQNITLIPNGINLNRFKTKRSNEVKDSFQLLFVGHEFDRKGLEYVIKSLKYLSSKINLIIVGGNSRLIKKYRNLAKQEKVQTRCKFVGKLENVEQAYHEADLFVFPTLYESWGLVGLEAMACGTPVLIYPVGGIHDYLQDGKNGFYIDHDPNDIAQKVQLLYNDEELRMRIIEEGLKTVKKYSWENVAKEYLDLFEKILEKKSSV